MLHLYVSRFLVSELGSLLHADLTMEQRLAISQLIDHDITNDTKTIKTALTEILYWTNSMTGKKRKTGSEIENRRNGPITTLANLSK